MTTPQHRAPGRFDEGGDAACWSHLVCPTCGRVTDALDRHVCADADGANVQQGERGPAEVKDRSR